MENKQDVTIDYPLLKINFSLDTKGVFQHRVRDHLIPAISQDKDYFAQYCGVWEYLYSHVLKLDAKKVLEFGTREAYSTRLFALALRKTGGHIWTVDVTDPKLNDREKQEFSNITFLKTDVTKLDWKEPVDILFIDDWHNKWHLYWELATFGKLARTIIIHDVVQNHGKEEWISSAVIEYCIQNLIPFTFIPLNGCGLIVIEAEDHKNFYEKEEIVVKGEDDETV